LAAQVDLFMMVGVLPRDLGVLRHDIDARAIASEMVAVLRTFDVPIDAQRASPAAMSTRKNGAG
jgi:hypothetical protein